MGDRELTPRQEEYFRLLEQLDPSKGMKRVIEDAKHDLRGSESEVVRGLSRVKGFTHE